jgi:hypothetical protein
VETKTFKHEITLRCSIPKSDLKRFAGARGLVETAAAASPRSIIWAEAIQQSKSFHAPPRRKNSGGAPTVDPMD